jgi:phage host-nuclease inhibitor protein Gam
MVIANTLFDALVTANVPRDQAHAVVEALEHRMTSELATKADLTREISEVRAEMKAEFAAVRAEMKAEFAAVRAEMKAEFAAVRAEMKADLAAVKVDIVKLDAKITDLQLKLTIRMGAMMVATASLLFTAQQIFGR